MSSNSGKILSIDGGGVRGFFSAIIIDLLNQQTGFLKHIDVFAGNSIGSLLALSLASGRGSDEINALCAKLGAVAFTPFNTENDKSHPRYKTDLFQQALADHLFHDYKLKDLNKKVIVPAFNICSNEGWRHEIFHNFSSSIHLDTKVVDLALRSMAAPLYFPSYQGFIDGGVFANNPSLLAYSCVKEHLGKDKSLSLLSIGTGIVKTSLPHQCDWGVNQWLSSEKKPEYPFFSLVTEGSIEYTHSLCKTLIGEKYHRVNADLKEFIAIDEINQLPNLMEIALNYPKLYQSNWKNLLLWIEKEILS